MEKKGLLELEQWVEENREKFLKQHAGKFIIVSKDKTIVDSYDTIESASDEALRIFEPEDVFLIHELTREQPVSYVIEALL